MSGFAASSPQRKKVREEWCINCAGASGQVVDPAHLWDRSLGGCDHPDCVVPLCRKCHELYDNHQLDLLPALVATGCFAEMAHMISAHRISPLRAVQRLSGGQP